MRKVEPETKDKTSGLLEKEIIQTSPLEQLSKDTCAEANNFAKAAIPSRAMYSLSLYSYYFLYLHYIPIISVDYFFVDGRPILVGRNC